MSPRDKIIFSWWGGANFFLCHHETKYFFLGGVGAFFFIWNLSRRDKIIFSWWVEPTKSSLFNFIWVRLHHQPRENYFVSSWHEGGSFHFIWDGCNLGTVGRISTFPRAKLIKIEILTIWTQDNENHVVILVELACTWTMSVLGLRQCTFIY